MCICYNEFTESCSYGTPRKMRSDGFLDDLQLGNQVLQHIKSGKYRLTKHAAEEQANDKIDLQDTLHVLRTGFHEKKKTSFNNVFQTWNYAIRGKTEESNDVRVIISFSSEMMIVTVMKLKS
jgi:hypothetical protein